MSQSNLKIGDSLSFSQLKEYENAKRDAEKWKRYEAMLASIESKKNVMKMSEFERYKELYKARNTSDFDIDNQEEVARLSELSREFFTRINPYEELIVIDDDNPDIVRGIFPKIYMKFNTLRGGSDTDHVISNFETKMNVPMRRDVHEEATVQLLAALASSQDIVKDPSIRQKEMLKYKNIEKALLNKTDITNKEEVKKEAVKDSKEVSINEWVFDDE